MNNTSVDVWPRMNGVTGTLAASSGAVYFTTFTPAVTMTVSTITMFNIGAASGLTLARMGLYTHNGTTGVTLVARTASDTTLFQATNSNENRSFDTAGGYPATYTLTAGSYYAIAVITVGGTPPSFVAGFSAPSLIASYTPRLYGRRGLQTDLPTSTTITSTTGDLPVFGRLVV
jgi:hypothetical protein